MHLTQASRFISQWFTIVELSGWRNAMVQQLRRIRLSPEARQGIERQLAAFREKFGRDPNDDDPILFDPDADDPVPLSDKKYERMMIEAMTEVGISKAMIFAFKRTGRIVTERNKHLLTAEELREWNDAVDEYRRSVDSGDVI
jgi:hypothetical protein